jgi:dipeptidyl aminopeptidase/acylaminoacyl peptidase
VSGYYPLKKGKDDKLLVSSSSFIENSVYRIIDISEKADPVIVSSMSKHGSKLGLSHAQVSEMYFEGAGEYCVQAWVVKPSNFDKEKKYPLALLIHGGPEDAWREAWSTRWNPAVWAEQGYVCILPNVTGSTGFGLDLVEGIYGQWGGRPYDDLANCFEYVQRHMPFVDTDNAIAAGASYGGYMANWIQGNSLGRKFKAIVCHDGIFSTQMLIAGDEFGGDKDFAGPMLPWKNWKHLEKWNPARPDLLRNWTTPMLVVHSDKDYRCIMSDGIAAYNTLQTLGTPSRLLNFPDEGHWVLKPENSLVWHKTVFEWINKYSGISDKKKESVEPIPIVV